MTIVRKPTIVILAAIMWIIAGAVIAFLSGAMSLVELSAASNKEYNIVMLISSLVITLFGIIILWIGIKTLQGKAKDTLGNSIGSLVFGCMFLAQSMQDQTNIVGSIFLSILATTMFIAGVLSLIGRDSYKTWLTSTSSQSAKIEIEIREKKATGRIFKGSLEKYCGICTHYRSSSSNCKCDLRNHKVQIDQLCSDFGYMQKKS